MHSMTASTGLIFCGGPGKKYVRITSFQQEDALQDLESRRKKVVGEPYEGKPCAVSRTERIATRGGRSSGQMTPR
jgi:hypothetical protein